MCVCVRGLILAILRIKDLDGIKFSYLRYRVNDVLYFTAKI